MSAQNPGTVQPVHSPGVNTLFRFLHVSNLREIEQTSSGGNGTALKMFIEGTSMQGRSTFLDAIESHEDPETIATVLQGVIDDFTPFSSFQGAKSLNPELYDMALWMNGFSAATPLPEITDKRSTVTALLEEDEELLWDNLFYQTLKGTSSKTTDTIVLMLKANEFIKKLSTTSVEEPFDEDTTQEFIEIANAIVTVPRKLVARPQVESLTGSPSVDMITTKYLSKVAKGDVAKYKIGILEGHVNELRDLIKLRHKMEYEAYSAALAAYNETVAQLIATAQCEQKTEEPDITYPPFEHIPIDELSTEFIGTYLSAEAQVTLTRFKKEAHSNIAEVIVEIEKETQKLYDIFFDSVQPNQAPLTFRGVQVPVKSRPSNNSIIVQAETIEGDDSLKKVFVTQYFEEPSTKLKNITITSGSSTSNSKVVSEAENHVTFLLFEEGLSFGSHTFNFDFSSDLEIFDGEPVEIEFDTQAPLFFTARHNFDGLPGSNSTALFGVKKIGVGDFLRVEQEICCYVPGEVSHIENIMAREYKEKATRQLTRTETITEETTERETENLTDNTSTERHDLHSEVSRVLQENRATQISANAGVQGGFGKNLTFQTSAGFSHSNSSGVSNSYSEAESIAKEVVERSMERIVEKMTYRRTARMLREFEETNKHGFDNRAGDKSVTGIYRWVDKIYDNKVMNYGKRLMYDFAIPEPAKNFKHWLQKGAATATIPKPPTAPLSPVAYGINDASKISRINSSLLAGVYGIEIEPLPPGNIWVAKSFGDMPNVTGAENGATKRNVGSYNYNVEIPENYMTVQYRYSFTATRGGANNSPKDSWLAIGEITHKHNDGVYGGHVTLVQHISGNLPVAIATHGIGGFGINVVADCWLNEDFIENWKAITYMQIMQAYHEQMQKYRDALAEYEAYIAAQTLPSSNTANDYRLNPMEARIIEQRELKRCCIELMLSPWPFNYKQGQNFYFPTPADNHSIQKDYKLWIHAEISSFFEEAFDWNIMSYTMYPYYWGDETQWYTMIKEKSSSDPIFEAFVQSGMAKVTVPVKPGFETRVLYFLDTGLVPLSKELLSEDPDQLYLTAVKNLKLEKPVQVGETWKTRMPTALTIIQDYSAPLNANGLPCFCEDGTPIATGNNLLNGIGESAGGSVTPSKGTTFAFPKHSSLGTIDIGKLLMNDGDGLAKVYQLSAGLTAQLGQYIIKLEDLADLTAESKITFVTKTELEVEFDRATWRNGETPTNALDELNLIRTHILSLSSLSFITPTIVDDNLVLNEASQESTNISLTAFPSGSLEIVTPSQPSSAAAPVGFPLGKLVAIENGKAVISSSNVETYELESEFAVNHSLFNSGAEIDFYSEDAFQAIFDHLVMPTADGKVKPLGLSLDDLNHDFENVYRNQILGVAIASEGLEVTVMRLPALSFMFHIMRRAVRKGVFSVSGLI